MNIVCEFKYVTELFQIFGSNQAMFACRYDPKTDTWTAVAPMSISRDAVGVCLLGDRLYAVGGYDGQSYLNTVEAYDPQTNEWMQVGVIICQPVLFLNF